MTKEEVLDKYEGNSIWGDLQKNRGNVYYEDDVLKALEDYGKFMYNKGIEDAVDHAEVIPEYHVFNKDEIIGCRLNTEEILKLKI